MSKNKRRAPDEPDPLAQMFSALWAALAAGEVLKAELETSRCLAMFRQLGIDKVKSDTIFIGMAKQRGKPEDAALLRLIMLLGSPAVKGRARTALGELTASGVYPASWVTEAGKAEPVRAVRVADRFGDSETIFVTYRYAGGEHTLQVGVDATDLPMVRNLALAEGAPGAAESNRFEIVEELALDRVRARLDDAMTAAESGAPTASAGFAALIPIARSRLRRLPARDGSDASDASDASDGVRQYTAEDRAALVREFLASPYAAPAVADDAASTRFWAEILTAWASRGAGHPLRAGPRTLRHLLSEYVPATYAVTAAQREELAAAVTAWARWSAAERGLDEEHMISMLPETLTAFPDRYDDVYAQDRRAYLADVAASDADIAVLRDLRAARQIVVPPRDERDEEYGADLADLDATDPDDRAAFLTADFGDCELPGVLSPEDFAAAVRQVAEELWSGEPSGTREHALALLAEGDLDRHDIMHALVQRSLSADT